MRIAVNTRLLLRDRLDGIGWFTHETLQRMVLDHPEHEFVFLFDRPFDSCFIYAKNVTPVVISPPARHPFLWYWWFEWSVPRALIKHKADVFLSQDGYLSLRSNLPSVSVLHDINFEHFPQQLPLLVRYYYRYFFSKFARHATVLATVSEFSKTDIANTYSLQPSSIEVVYNGVNPCYGEAPFASNDAIRQRFSQGVPFFLFIGTIHQRKNIRRLLLAFDAYKKETQAPLRLLLIGKKMWWTSKMETTFQQMEYQQAVHFLGRVDPVTELRDVLSAARAMVYVPTFEGFGVPVVEAQLCGVPVITSNVSSLPEAAGDGALFCDPYSVDSIKEAMHRIDQDETLRLELIAKGKKNAKRFSWEASARALWQCILKATEG
jgi:glycosyltransferase involved in cell wall biosynthesis